MFTFPAREIAIIYVFHGLRDHFQTTVDIVISGNFRSGNILVTYMFFFYYSENH